MQPRWLHLCALALPLIGGLGCQACPPEAREQLVRPDFHDPVESARNFLAAMACDRSRIEYECLAESLKLRYDADYQTYLLARPELREELGSAVDLAFRLQLQSDPIVREDGILLELGYGGHVYVRFLMVAQHYYDLHLNDGRTLGGFLDRSPAAQIQLDRRQLVATIQDEDGSLRGVLPEEIERFQIGTEWKLGDVLPVEDPQN